MRRTFGILVLLLCCSVPCFIVERRAGGLTASARIRFPHPLTDARGCKPRAPLALTLRVIGEGDGSVVELALSVTPRAALGPVRWKLLLPDGAELVDGAASGELAAGASGTEARHVRVRLPTSADFARVTLVADTELDAAGTQAAVSPAGARPVTREPLQSSASLTWGLPGPSVPARRLVDVQTGAGVAVASVPATHRIGR